MADHTTGLIHVYTGDGKGKTTAALGLALRAAGHGWHTYVGQFMKGQEYGELEGARMLGVDAAGRPWLTIVQYGRPSFVHVDRVTPEDVRLARQGLASAEDAMRSGAYQIVVLDEINVALYFHLVSTEDVLALIERKPGPVELVLTGRRVPEAIVARADYVTEMREVRHPYQRGIQARPGIEC
ncbi:MAG: cob(I)yrinic acid a,c-diamide adenosyltransferase [Anaerolineae bacterium]|nr:cob(I)yrinic acid a,c-diamide adenosyltransferase [Anaerolineae bacterium]